MRYQDVRADVAGMPPVLFAGAAGAYDAAGVDYLAYADGDASEPFGFDGNYSCADREIWRRVDRKLEQLAADGRHTLRVLDVGCGPGTWFKRVVLSARELGFTDIEVHGIDLSPGMVALSAASAEAVSHPGTRITLATGDVTTGLPFADDSFDVTMCLYGVLNHVSVAAHANAAAELARVTLGTLFVTVRTVGSLPTIYVDELDRARAFRQDNDADWMEVDLDDGRHLAFPSHLFTGADLHALFRLHLATTAMVGLDLFHSRFASHPNWNPRSIAGQHEFEQHLSDLERRYASDPHFINRASHILLVGEKRDHDAALPETNW